METHSCHASLLLPVQISHYKQRYTHRAGAQARERPGSSVLLRLQERGESLESTQKKQRESQILMFCTHSLFRIRENKLKY